MLRLARFGAGVILEQERHARERSRRQRAVGVPPGPVELAVDHGVQDRVQRLDPLNSGLYQLPRMDLAPSYERGQGRGVDPFIRFRVA